MSKVIVGMSGGVDSAVAAYLLKEQGYEVIGVTLRVWDDNGEEGRCCEIDDARRSAQIIGIRYYPHNCTSLFGSCVVEPFVKAYLEGLTPNPCIECNRHVKWAKLMELMKVYEADYVATGHYAYVERLPNGRYSARTADQASKDQTYMLYKLTQEQLSRTLMPLGQYTKDEVRKIAEDAGLPCAHKEESQEICFVTEGRYTDFISEHTDKALPEEGNFVDEEGNVLRSCTILVGNANQVVGRLHERMATILPDAMVEDWLNPREDTDYLLTLLSQPFNNEEMLAVKVSRQVNSVRNQSAEVMLPVE